MEEKRFETGRETSNFTAIFDTIKGRIFTEIHTEVIISLRNLLPPEIKDTLSTRATFDLTSNILDDSLQQVKSSLMEIYHQDSLLTSTASMNVAKKLLLATVTKMQDSLQMCTVSGWLSVIRGSPVNSNEQLDDLLPLVTAKAVGAVFQTMLSICTEGTSKDSTRFGSATPLCNFFQAVADNITSEVSPSAATHRQSTSETDTVETKSQIRPRCERILENIIFNCANWQNDTDTTERFSMCSSKAFMVEASKVISTIFTHEVLSTPPASDSELESSTLAAASGVISALTSELISTVQDFELVDPTIDPNLYTAQVQTVSRKVLKTTQGAMKDFLVKSFMVRANGDMTNQDSKFNLIFESKWIVKMIIESVMDILALFEGKDSAELITKQFLQSLKENLDLFKQELIRSFDTHQDSLSNPSIPEKVLDHGVSQQHVKEETRCSAAQESQSKTAGCSVRTTARRRFQRFWNCVSCCGISPAQSVSSQSSDSLTVKLPNNIIIEIDSDEFIVIPSRLLSHVLDSDSNTIQGKRMDSISDTSEDLSREKSVPTARQRKSFFSRVAAAFTKTFRKRGRVSA